MKKVVLCLAIVLLWLLGPADVLAEIEVRQKVIEVLQSSVLREKLYAPVNISVGEQSVVSIMDRGDYIMQYMIMEPAVSADANLVVDPNFKIPSSCNKLVIVTHGWIDKANGDWPTDVSNEIRKKVDPNEWVCGFFDWQGGAAVVNPVDAVKYSRDIAGPRLAKAILKLGKFEHVHLIGHSAGCWAIDKAAKIITQEMESEIHLTFLDAYVPLGWDQTELGKFESKKHRFVEHYYTRDITMAVTEEDLSQAHNVDITDIDPGINEHEFPYRWYYATVAGKYRDGDREAGHAVLTRHKELDYGFNRSLEAGQANWQKSLTLQKANEAVKLKETKKKWHGLNIFK